MSNLITRSITGKDNQPVLFPTGISIGSGASGGINDIGIAGQPGFGVGTHPGPLPTGFAGLDGYTNPTSDNYGNYQYTDGSVMCWIPAFFYKITVNVIDIKPYYYYESVAVANAAGYALHRAFYDGGAIQPGFFVDKYICSKSEDGLTSGRSVKNGVPISLTTDVNYTGSNGMTGCTGILADSVVLARARGTGRFNVMSVFMNNAIALLSLAHAQASSATTYCAWYNATYNFPKGCNSNTLSDVNDTSLTFVTAGDAGNAMKPLTGSANFFAKITHNGQNSGVADVNGSMLQCLLGVTSAGSNGTSTTQITDGNAYVLKTSVALASLTGGWTAGATGADAWGDATHLALLYDAVTALFPWGVTTGNTRFGNGASQVFSGATSGDAWLRTACGVQQDTNATSVSGTNEFGSDLCYQWNGHNLCPVGAGNWSYGTHAGVFTRRWDYCRSNSNYALGFRASAYGL